MGAASGPPLLFAVVELGVPARGLDGSERGRDGSRKRGRSNLPIFWRTDMLAPCRPLCGSGPCEEELRRFLITFSNADQDEDLLGKVQ